ncbi:membrane protein insertase YidC [Gordonia sp. HY442]|uniref:membrane protein insertase YidC n=1 Tax=Gordonia zhenghanii TaxID=2911516 RepID=UPI001EFF9D74|nr:membrane protein insertase YidC [Gordonia zhenghanii]MCF8603736.1 membrane protein insertase YidC [Gordonia zhenghanii]
MLNFIYYPVSWIMWVWHWLFDKVLPDSPGGSGVAWALSVVFLVFTLRAILYKPFVKQIRTTKQMQEINPQMQAIRKKYANDRVKMTEEMQKLQKEHGFNPLLGCLPMFMQIPVFIGLFHVLRSFNRMGTGTAMPIGGTAETMSAEQTRSIGNYAFSPEQVQNFLDARLFGVPLSSFITEPVEQFKAFVEPGQAIDFTRWQIGVVVVPLMIVASIATHMNSRASVGRQTAAASDNPQTRIMNKLALYVFPLGILVTGPFFPVAILLYWVSNNLWTYGQQHLVFGRIAKEEEAAKEEKEERLRANAPKPGAKPGSTKRGATAVADADTAVADDASDEAPKTSLKKGGQKKGAGAKADAVDSKDSGDAKDGASAVTEQPASAPKKPAPGQRPNRPGGARQSGNKRNKKNRQGRKR